MKRAKYPESVLMRLDAMARVGWAKYYDELQMSTAFARENEILLERINTLMTALFDLVDDVLHGRNVKAFATAMRVSRLITEFDKGRRS